MSHRQRPLPRAHDSRRGAAALRGRGRGARRAPQRPRAPRGRPASVRRGRGGQDRHRCHRLAARARPRSGGHLLGTPARPVDARPGPRPAGPGDLLRSRRRPDAVRGRVVVARRRVPAPRGRRRDAAHRPVGHADDGQGPDARTVGARRAADRRGRRPAGAPQVGLARPAGPGRGVGAHRRRRGGRALRRRRPEAPATGAGVAPGRHHRPAGEDRLPLPRRSTDGLRRGHARRRHGEEPGVRAVELRQLPVSSGRR